jgi:hypothetical protein
MATKLEKAIQTAQYIDGDTLATTLAFKSQCFLIRNMYELARQAGRFHSRTGHTRGGLAAWRQQTEIYRDQYNGGVYVDNDEAMAPSGYKYVAPVLSSGTGRAATSYSNLIRRKNADKIVEISTDLMAILVPTLRIYKMEYQSKLDPDDGTKLIPDLDQAPVEREVIFDDFIDPADLERIFNSKQGRVGATGIKSFQWDLKGVNPAEVDANITAQLNIYFNNVSDIFTDEKGVRQLKAGRQGKASFLDLIIYAPQTKVANMAGLNPHDPLYMLYDGVFFEIKAVVGWAVPPKVSNMFPRPDGTTLEDFREAIRHSQTVLFLQLTTHRFDFNQDGTANLVINYRARYDNKRNTDDIFNISHQTGTRAVSAETYNELLKEQRESPAKFKSPDSPSSLRLKDVTFRFQEQLANRYNTIINKLLTRLYTVEAKPGQLDFVKKKTPAGAGSGFVGTTAPNSEELYNYLAEVREGEFDQDTGWAQAKNLGVDPNITGAEINLSQGEVGAQSAKNRKVWRSGFFPDSNVQPLRVKSFAGTLSTTEEFASPKDHIKDVTGQYIKDGDEIRRRNPDEEEAQKSGLGTSVQLQQLGAKRARGLAQIRGGSRSSGTRRRRRRTVANMSFDVPFFFLGDLIDIAVETLLENRSPEDRATLEKTLQKFITTDLEFFDYKQFDQIGEEMTTKIIKEHNLAPGRGGTAAPNHPLAGFTPGTYFKMLRLGRLSLDRDQRKRVFRPINIASIPIQFDYFLEWYAQTVAAERRQFYFLNNFIVDVLTQLVRPVLSSNCYYGIPAQRTHISMIDFLVNKDAKLGNELFPAGKWSANAAAIAVLEHGKYLPAPCTSIIPAGGIRTAGAPGTPGALIGGSGPGLYSNFKVITLTTVHPDLLEGKYKEDREVGIYHFIVGADRGLLKEATFNRMDAPYLREARIDRNRIAGAEQLRELYNVNLNLYGAPILKPGQLIYVTPSPLGFGDPRNGNSTSRYLGIGGYHMVVSVQSVIDSQGYQTRIKALHQAMPSLAGSTDVVMGLNLHTPGGEDFTYVG